MNHIRVFLARFAGLFYKRRMERDLKEELDFHLQTEIDEQLRRGRSLAEARYAAHRKLGNLQHAQETYRDAYGVPLIFDIARDCYFATRRLAASRTFTLFSVLTLALGIGATTAVYSVIDAVMFESNGIPEADRVVGIYHMRPPGSGPMIWLSWPDYEDLRARQTRFSFMTAWSRFRHPVTANGQTERLMGEMVEGEYFSVVGTRPEVGRLLGPADNLAGGSNVALISHSFWERSFGGDPEILDRELRIAGQVFEIVGVVEPDFRGVDMPRLVPTPIWIPLETGLRLDPLLVNRRMNRESRWVSVKARVEPNSTVDGARAEVSAIAALLDAALPIGVDLPPNRRLPFNASRPWAVIPTTDVYIHEMTDAYAVPLALALAGAVVLVLIVVCTNLANLTLARMADRRHELSVRLALGASRWRLVRELVVEGVLTALAGGLLSLPLTRGLMVAFSKPIRLGEGLYVQTTPTLSAPVLTAALAATVVTILVFSAVPALWGTKRFLQPSLARESSTMTPGWRGRRLLIAGQVMASTILLTLAFLCVQQVRTIVTADLGVDLDRVAGVQVDLEMTGYEEDPARALIEDAVRQTRTFADVEQAGIASAIPLSSPVNVLLGTPENPLGSGTIAASAWPVTGTPEIFSIFDIDLVRGRRFDERDVRGAPPVAVVTETTARDLFGQPDVVGLQFQFRDRQIAGETEDPPIETLTIIGVAEDVNGELLGQSPSGYVFRPWAQHYSPEVTLVARTSGDPAGWGARLRRMMTDLDPDIVILDAGPARVLAGAGGLIPKIVGSIAVLLGGFALFLALTGLHGVVSYLVRSRTREVAIRMALGADRRRVTVSVLRDAMRPIVTGLVLGLGIGIALRLALQRAIGAAFVMALLPELDFRVIAAVPIPFVLFGLLAAYWPARKAARIDPNAALRLE